MIRLEFPRANLEGLSTDEKISALQAQVDTLTDNLKIILESIDDDISELRE